MIAEVKTYKDYPGTPSQRFMTIPTYQFATHRRGIGIGEIVYHCVKKRRQDNMSLS
jgi:hypothetical protein